MKSTIGTLINADGMWTSIIIVSCVRASGALQITHKCRRLTREIVCIMQIYANYVTPGRTVYREYTYNIMLELRWWKKLHAKWNDRTLWAFDGTCDLHVVGVLYWDECVLYIKPSRHLHCRVNVLAINKCWILLRQISRSLSLSLFSTSNIFASVHSSFFSLHIATAILSTIIMNLTQYM